MAMVFCRGCAKEIHETAQVCPNCGAPQGLSTSSNSSRSTLVLIVMALGWTMIMWFIFLLIGGFIIGFMNPDNGAIAGQQFGKAASIPSLFFLGCVSAILTKLGKLPGTKRNEIHKGLTHHSSVKFQGDIVGFFEKLAEDSFKVTPAGEIIFYPNGPIGKGRLVPDQDTKQKLLNFHKRLYKLTFFVVVPYIWLASLIGFTIYSLSPILLFTIYYLYKQHQITKNLQKHHVKLGFGEAIQKRAKSLPNWYYWILGILSIQMIVVTLCIPALCNKPFLNFLVPVIGLSSLGLLGLVLSIKMYKLKNLTNGLNGTSASQPPQS